MGLKALKDLRVFPETQVDLAERRARKDLSALRGRSVTLVNRVTSDPKDLKDRKAPSGPKDPLENLVSRAIPALRDPKALKGLRDRKGLRAYRAQQGSGASKVRKGL